MRHSNTLLVRLDVHQDSSAVAAVPNALGPEFDPAPWNHGVWAGITIPETVDWFILRDRRNSEGNRIAIGSGHPHDCHRNQLVVRRPQDCGIGRGDVTEAWSQTNTIPVDGYKKCVSSRRVSWVI
jgi:hypothetical protein